MKQPRISRGNGFKKARIFLGQSSSSNKGEPKTSLNNDIASDCLLLGKSIKISLLSPSAEASYHSPYENNRTYNTEKGRGGKMSPADISTL